MTQINLMKALVQRMGQIVNGYRFQESDGTHATRQPKVWAQHLPEKLYDNQADPADYPFVQVVIVGTTLENMGERSCQVAILVAGYDDGLPVDPGDADSARDQQGWLIPAEMMDRIVLDLQVNPRVGGKYDLQYPLTTELPPEQPAPLWYGLVNASFTLPAPQQSFGMGNVDEAANMLRQDNIEEIFTSKG